MNRYRCRHFAAHELVPKNIYDLFQNPDIIYGLFDENALRILDLLREWAGVGLIINNWYWKGTRTQCGLRVKDADVGASLSKHKLGMAFDIISIKLSTLELWQILDANSNKLPCKIRIEKTSNGKPITWLHFDTDASSSQTTNIYYFNA